LVDGERVQVRLSHLEPLLRALEEVRAQGEDAYLADAGIRHRAERELQLAIQICIDVGAHLVSELGLEPPSDYGGVFARLREAGILDDRLADQLRQAAGLRNVLVHAYVDLDDREVWKALDQLDDLRAFAAAAERAAQEL
jgi:uncharacterized protein YutE (UPF0331/DUF86 family)